MKYLFLFLVIIFLIIAGLFYFKPTLFSSLQSSITGKISTTINTLESVSNKTTIYKWTDSDGGLQISNNPPPVGIKYEIEQIQHSKNIMPSEQLTGKNSK